MKTSAVIDINFQPASPLADVYYRPKSDEALAAELAASESLVGTVGSEPYDLAQYEFIGDGTYARYLQNRGAI